MSATRLPVKMFFTFKTGLWLSWLERSVHIRKVTGSSPVSPILIISQKIPLMLPSQQPSLFGLIKSNRDFRNPQSWGKNIFNNAFPTALACYMESKNVAPVYFTLNKKNKLTTSYLSVEYIFGISPSNSNTYYSFESDFVPLQPLVVNNLPRADLVVIDEQTGICKSGLEIKLTAIPDNSTFHLPESNYGCEIVVRPDTIVYLALSIVSSFRASPSQLSTLLHELPTISDWTDIAEVSPLIPRMAQILDEFMVANLHLQHPLVMQPIWKTEGKKLTLHTDAFDIFVWSNFAFTRLFFREANLIRNTVSRGARSIAWLTRMIHDFTLEGRIDHRKIIDGMSFNTRNDKAFAVNGIVTHMLMVSPELLKPRIKRDETKNIILGGGELFLSPERRLDAAILNTPELFE